jgi:predicted cation transporter
MRLRRAAQATAIGLAVVAVGAGVALGQSGRSSSLESVATKLKDDFTHLQENCPDLVTPACEQSEEQILAYGQAHLEGDRANDPALILKVQAVMELYQRGIDESPVGREQRK